MKSFLICLFGSIGAYQNQVLMHNIPRIVGNNDLHYKFS